MARFRSNDHQLIVESLVKHDGLTIERVQRFDHSGLLPESSRWSQWAFRIIRGGMCYVRNAGQTYALTPNSICWSSALGEPVYTRGLPGTGSDMVIVQFAQARWNMFLQQNPLFHSLHTELLAAAGKGLIAITRAMPQILHVLQQIITLHGSDTATPLVLQNHSTLLLQLLGQMRFDAAQQRPAYEYKRVEAAQAQITQHLAKPPSLEQIACALGISVRQLQRDFLACTGMTPIRYVNLMRLSEANLLLAETSLPVNEIATQLGYASPGHFSAAFKRAYNCSPRDVREPTRLVNQTGGIADNR